MSNKKTKLIAATVSLILMVFTWVVMGEILQKMQSSYNKPYFISYIVHSGKKKNSSLIPKKI